MKSFAILIFIVFILSACTSKGADPIKEEVAAADSQETEQERLTLEEEETPKEAEEEEQTQEVIEEKAETQKEEKEKDTQEASTPLSHKQAEDLVRTHLNLQENSNVHVKYDHDADNGDYIIQVYEVVIDDPKTGEGHTATWGWYGVNKTTKNVYDAMN